MIILAQTINKNKTIVSVRNLKKTFNIKTSKGKKISVHAVSGVDFDIYEGETLGLVGESGCGKSTLGRTILGLYKADAESSILFCDKDITKFNAKEQKEYTSSAQIVFQDPAACLNPRRNIEQILSEPFIIHKACSKDERKNRILKLIDMVGLADYHLTRFPHELSGGQKQRVVIARALALNPKFIVCDEAVAALDVSIQAQIINLLEDLQEKLSLTYLFISHNLDLVHHTSNRVGVMYLGKLVELSDRDNIYDDTLHPYTKALISAIPSHDKTLGSRIILKGDLPSPISPPSGCHFNTRCPSCKDICKQVAPKLMEVKPNHFVACHLYTK